MKRAHDGETRNNKKVRIDTNQDARDPKASDEQNFNLDLRRSFKYLAERSRTERPPGHVYGIVKMLFPHPNRFSLLLIASAARAKEDSLEVILSRLHLESLGPLRVGDKMRISLKGARIEKHQKKDHLPVKLVFTEGYHLRYVSKDEKDGSTEINTFMAPTLPPKAAQPDILVQSLAGPSVLAPQPVKVDPDLKKLSKKEKRRRKSSERLATQSAQEPAKLVETPVSALTPSHGTISNAQAERQTQSHVLQPPREYMPFKSLQSKAGEIVSVIGVVLRADPLKQCRGGDQDWMSALRISDCTDFELNGNPSTQGVAVNLFSKKKSNLPDPEIGDIIILKKLKIEYKYNRTFGVGRPDQHYWAIYSKEKSQIHHNASNSSVPGPSGLFGFSPIYHATPSDITYCDQLLKWWIKTQKQQEEEADRTRVGPISYGPRKRPHRLIGELETPGANTADEYFDCTVEILRKYAHDNAVYTIWVTDYTKNARAFPIDGSWCPAPLASYAFRIDMWDAASEIGPTMKESYLEAKIVETKISVLEEGTSESEQFKSLLQRKKAWEVETGYFANSCEDQLLKDAPVERFFHCTVEILHAEYTEGRASTVYCTDYTLRNDLGGIPPRSPWMKDLENRIVKFVLSGGQSFIAETLKPGDFCRFKKMRLRKDPKGGFVFGVLEGNQDLMEKLNPKNKENVLLQGLFKRKENIALFSSPSSTFQEILDLNQFPEKFRVAGHVVAYEPRNLDQAIFLECKSCNRLLGNLEKMCLECESDEDLDPLCNLFLTLQDKDMNRVLVSISEKSIVLRDLRLSAFLDDGAVRNEFRERLRSLVGTFYADKSDPKELNGPTLSIELIAWEHDGDVAFSLLDAQSI